MTNQGKILIFSAPSGSGKTTIVNHLLKQNFNLCFSISATTRAPRGTELHGKDYYFFSVKTFKEKINSGEFLEWEEVYDNKFYGTLKSEIDRITSQGKNVVFDVDVVGGHSLKKMFGDDALSIFIQPPSIKELEKRLIARNTDSMDVIQQRINKAAHELTYSEHFDAVIVNDDLLQAQIEAKKILNHFFAHA